MLDEIDAIQRVSAVGDAQLQYRLPRGIEHCIQVRSWGLKLSIWGWYRVPNGNCPHFSIEFDRDGEYFAIAGVTKKIKLYDYNSVLQDAVDIHYPICEMQCNSKIRYVRTAEKRKKDWFIEISRLFFSCVSWNPYSKGILASSDYEGIVQLWDVVTNKSIKRFKVSENHLLS